MAKRSFFNSVGASALALALTAAATFAPATVQADGKVDAIKAAGVVTVGTEAAYPPFEFIKDGQITGYGKQILGDTGVARFDLDCGGRPPG